MSLAISPHRVPRQRPARRFRMRSTGRELWRCDTERDFQPTHGPNGGVANRLDEAKCGILAWEAARQGRLSREIADKKGSERAILSMTHCRRKPGGQATEIPQCSKPLAVTQDAIFSRVRRGPDSKRLSAIVGILWLDPIRPFLNLLQMYAHIFQVSRIDILDLAVVCFLVDNVPGFPHCVLHFAAGVMKPNLRAL